MFEFPCTIINILTPCWIPQPVSCHSPEAVLQFLSAPEDRRKKRPKRVESNIAVINKHTAKLHHVGSFDIE